VARRDEGQCLSARAGQWRAGEAKCGKKKPSGSPGLLDGESDGSAEGGGEQRKPLARKIRNAKKRGQKVAHRFHDRERWGGENT